MIHLSEFEGITPEAIGLFAADSLLTDHADDGSNQLGRDINGEINVPYSDISGYKYVNQDASQISDLDLWTPEDELN